MFPPFLKNLIENKKATLFYKKQSHTKTSPKKACLFVDS